MRLGIPVSSLAQGWLAGIILPIAQSVSGVPFPPTRLKLGVFRPSRAPASTLVPQLVSTPLRAHLDSSSRCCWLQSKGATSPSSVVQRRSLQQQCGSSQSANVTLLHSISLLRRSLASRHCHRALVTPACLGLAAPSHSLQPLSEQCFLSYLLGREAIRSFTPTSRPSSPSTN
ncbi:hypothetical protein LY78DRAFT_80540 [Colletotrichum sublineola]|nr:hypothetical protein LY78DRAFT_80540 [Colletotrichum sublineola]